MPKAKKEKVVKEELSQLSHAELKRITKRYNDYVKIPRYSKLTQQELLAQLNKYISLKDGYIHINSFEKYKMDYSVAPRKPKETKEKEPEPAPAPAPKKKEPEPAPAPAPKTNEFGLPLEKPAPPQRPIIYKNLTADQQDNLKREKTITEENIKRLEKYPTDIPYFLFTNFLQAHADSSDNRYRKMILDSIKFEYERLIKWSRLPNYGVRGEIDAETKKNIIYNINIYKNYLLTLYNEANDNWQNTSIKSIYKLYKELNYKKTYKNIDDKKYFGLRMNYGGKKKL